jgi:hypothetical protein
MRRRPTKVPGEKAMAVPGGISEQVPGAVKRSKAVEKQPARSRTTRAKRLQPPAFVLVNNYTHDIR